MQKRIGGAVLVLIGVALGLFTNGKLNTMAKIRGEKPGAEIVARPLHRLETDTVTTGGRRASRRSDQAYFASWRGEGGAVEGRDRVPEEVWRELDAKRKMASEVADDEDEQGDVVTVDVAYLDGEMHLRRGVYASDGNLTFDRVLLAIEVLAALAGAVMIALSFKKEEGPQA